MNDMIVIPDDVAATVRGAAHAVPASAHELTEVRRRYRRRRSRWVAATAGLATVAIGIAAAAVPMIARNLGPGRPEMVDSTTSVAARPRPAAPPQRLLITVAVAIPPSGKPPIGIVAPPGILEVLPDNSLARHELPAGMDGGYGAFALPDGRLVLLNATAPNPGVPRRNAPSAPGVTISLVVLRPDGTIESSRDVRGPGEEVVLIGATVTTAYLERPSGLVALDLATGTERPVMPPLNPSPRNPEVRDDLKMDLGDNTLGVFSESPDPKTCDLTVFDLGTGARVASSRLTFLPGCMSSQFRLSPDGRSAALIYGKPLDQGRNAREQWLAVVDVATGAVRQDRLLFREAVPLMDKGIAAAATGLAWSDPVTLRVATANPPAADRAYTVDELLKVETVQIG